MKVLRFLLYIYTVFGQEDTCNKCSTYGEYYYYCVSYNSYKICSMDNGLLSPDPNQSGITIFCKRGFACSLTSQNHPCTPQTMKNPACPAEKWSDQFCYDEKLIADPSDIYCRKYRKCIKNFFQDTYSSQSLSCPEEQQFSEQKQKCVTEQVASCLSMPVEEENTEIDYPQPTAKPTKNMESFRCYKTGTFRDPRQKKCSAVVKCTYDNKTKAFKQERKRCPFGTQFSLVEGRCRKVQQRLCPRIKLIKQFCVKDGFFSLPGDKTCSKFIQCEYKRFEDGFREVEHNCPIFEQFDAIRATCTRQQQENCPKIDLCYNEGKFPDNGDVTCRIYIQCVMGAKSLIGIRTECAPNMQFDKNSRECSNVQQEGCLVVTTIEDTFSKFSFPPILANILTTRDPIFSILSPPSILGNILNTMAPPSNILSPPSILGNMLATRAPILAPPSILGNNNINLL